MTTPDQLNVVPFGKYKGRLIEELLTDDPAYLQWLVAQDWFRSKFVTLHQIIINRGAEPEETHEHNALQVLFLDKEFCRRFLRHLYPDWEKLSSKTENTFGASALTSSRHRYPANALRGCMASNTSSIGTKLATASDMSLPSVARRPNSLSCSTHKRSLGADVLLTARATAVAKNSRVWAIDYLDTTTIEIKPTVSDDYPAVLRQMRRARTRVLFLEQYTGKGASREQFIQTFKTARIEVVFRDEV